MDEKTCLNCKWEPKWDWYGTSKYRRRGGRCQFPVKLPSNRPRGFRLSINYVEVYSDESGMPADCPGWTRKERLE